MRTDLGMRKGKMIAQGAHASMAVFFNKFKNDQWLLHAGTPCTSKYPAPKHFGLDEDPVHIWCSNSFAKICVRADSESELLELHSAALAAGLPAALITDSGRTEFNGVPTITCCAIGPAFSEDIDKITGHLKLL